MVQKGQKEKKYASARRGKVKKRKNTLLRDAERSKREKTRFCTARKGQKEKNYASARRRKAKKKNYEEKSGFLNAKREGKYVEKWLSKVLKKSFVLLQVVARLP